MTPLLLLASALPTAGASDCAPLAPWVDALDAHPHCLTSALMGLTEAAGEVPELRECAAEALAARGLPSLPSAASAGLPTRPDGAPAPPVKALRDTYRLPNYVESDNFVVRWGDGVSVRDAEATAAAFETAWQVELLDMDYPTPRGADDYKFNVYVGDTGRGAPSALGAAGYYYFDGDSFPMIVMALSMVQDVAQRGKNTAAHEFFHALQGAADSFAYEGEGAWYYEATASWIEVEVYPDDPIYAEMLFGFSFFPHLALNFFDYPDEGTLVEYHQYGAFIFPRYITEHVGDWRIIRQTWLEAGGERDPLVVLDDILQAEHGTTLNAAFVDFALRNLTWDYAHGEWYAYYHDYMEDYYPRETYRVTASHFASTDGWKAPPAELQPQRFGANYIQLRPPQGGDNLRVRFNGEGNGDSGSPPDWSLRVVAELNGVTRVEALEVPLPEEGVVLEGFGEADEVWLVVVNTANRLVWDETFPYQYAMEPEGELVAGDSGLAGDDTGDVGGDTGDTGDIGGLGPKGCGCASGAGGASGWGLLLGLAALLRRRQRRAEA